MSQLEAELPPDVAALYNLKSEVNALGVPYMLAPCIIFTKPLYARRRKYNGTSP
jgi:hypothetical protein